MSIIDSSTSLSTTWTEQSIVDFTAGTIASITEIIAEVQNTLHRGTLSASTTPTSTQVQSWAIRAKGELSEIYGFSWRRRYAYADTSAGSFRYSLPPDYNGGGSETTLRDLTNNEVIPYVDNATFDHAFPDPAGSSNSDVKYYTIRNRELWLSTPASGANRLELQYLRSGDDNTQTDFTYIPQIIRYKIIDFCNYRAFLLLQQYDAAQMYKQEWMMGVQQSKKGDGKKKWSQLGYRIQNWMNAK
jgi:hypothetical protein